MEVLKHSYDLELTDKDNRQGWAFGRPVGITTDQWPRSRINGREVGSMVYRWRTYGRY